MGSSMTFDSTLRAETNEAKEIQKADFDLLDKINRNSREVDSLVKVIDAKLVSLTPISVTIDQDYTITSTDSVINVNTGTATITIPESLPMGHTVTIRKISSTAGTVTIASSGSDTITRASLTSVTLTSDGDFWSLQKASATRWDIVDGIESKINGVNASYRYAPGTAESYGELSITPSAPSTPTMAVYTYELPFDSLPRSALTNVVSSVVGTTILGTSTTNRGSTTSDIYLTATNTTSRTVSVRFDGRWYP
jgi:hypothetical protein